MKNLITVVISALLLTACSTSAVKKEITEKKNIDNKYKNTHVLAEVCANPSTNNHLTVNITERSGKTISSNSVQLPVKSVLGNNLNLYSVLLGHPHELTYFTVENAFQPTTYFLYKRDFTKYSMNDWSQWEDPDYLFKEGSEYKFLWLSTREIDQTHDLLKIQFKNQKSIKVRFKLTTMESYNKENQTNSDTIIAKNIANCN